MPAEHRRALGIAEGDEVLVGVSGGSIRIQTRQGALKRARGVVKRRAVARETRQEDLGKTPGESDQEGSE